MHIDYKNINIYLKPGRTDFRKQINGLSLIIQDEIKKDVFKGDLFIFCNKTRNRMKILYWDKNGFALWFKRLEKDKFPWPKNSDEVKEIKYEELKMLLSGIDFFNSHQKIFFEEI